MRGSSRNFISRVFHDRIGRPLSVLNKQHGISGNASNQLRWSWSYATNPSRKSKPSIIASGELITDNDRSLNRFHEVLGISGIQNGVSITGLIPSDTAIPGNVDPLTGIPYVVDNLIRPAYKYKQVGQLSTKGIGFSLADGSYSNILYANFENPPVYLDFHSRPPFPDGLVAPNTETPIHFQARIIS